MLKKTGSFVRKKTKNRYDELKEAHDFSTQEIPMPFSLDRWVKRFLLPPNDSDQQPERNIQKLNLGERTKKK